MLCTNGHNNPDTSQNCSVCGINTFHPRPQFAPQPVFYSQPPRTNGNAIASMVCGIVWCLGVTSIVALVLGYKAKREIAASNESGEGMATAGIVLGWVGVVGGTIYIILIIAAFSRVSSFQNCVNLGQTNC